MDEVTENCGDCQSLSDEQRKDSEEVIEFQEGGSRESIIPQEL